MQHSFDCLPSAWRFKHNVYLTKLALRYLTAKHTARAWRFRFFFIFPFFDTTGLILALRPSSRRLLLASIFSTITGSIP